MFPIDILLTYTGACLLLVLTPGPDNLLAIGRGLSQGRAAACVSSVASGAGVLLHVTSAVLGLTLLIHTSAVAFWVVKFAGAGYLSWLGVKVLRTRSLITLKPAARQPLRKIFLTGFLSAALNPKPGLFVLAFIPQFVSPARGDVTTQMLIYGLWFILLTTTCFTFMGLFASRLSSLVRAHARVVAGLNVGAGIMFIAFGLSIAALKQK
jgi:threonine/homoserine/homoserine lactone efflux protein